MKLTNDQIRHYDDFGYVMLSGILTEAEVELIQSDAEILRTPKRGHPDANVYEKDGTTLRAAWAVETDSEACRLAIRLPKIFGLVRQLTGRDTYLYQSRLNYKVAKSGDVFQWHQDYGSWAQDGAPDGGDRNMLSVLIMLDDTTSESGPLRFIPGSHKEGLLKTEYDVKTTSYALHCIPDRKIEQLMEVSEPIECTGQAGTVVFFSGNLVHGSSQNTSDKDRRNLYFAYNICENIPDPNFEKREHANNYIMSEDTSPLTFVDSDALIQLANERGMTASSPR